MRRAKPQSWNDVLAIILLVGMPLMWVFARLNDIVLGATISGWMLVVQFYFRKSFPEPPDHPVGK